MTQCFPLKKFKITTNNTPDEFLTSYVDETEIPLPPHPGSFGYVRKNHIHEGVDLYAEEGDPVFAIEEGFIITIKAFTGSMADSPWWNDTYSILIEHRKHVINYGEITPLPELVVGSFVKAGDLIGNIKTVLKKDKGRPMSMLHLEMYKKGTLEPIKEWSLDQEQPECLLDPTHLLLTVIEKDKSI